MNTSVVFADAKVKKTLEKLKTSKTEDRKLYDFLIRAFEDLEKDAFCAIQIQKNLIPKEYDGLITKIMKGDSNIDPEINRVLKDSA